MHWMSDRRLRRSLIWTIVGLLCTTPAPPLAAQTPTPQDQATALDAIRKLGLGRNLPMLAFQAASRTQTYAIAVSQIGDSRARGLLVQQVQQAAPRYQDQWDRNLAASHLERLTAAELASVAELGPNSPSVPKVLSEQNAIGTAMQARSSRLLTDMVAEVLEALFRDVPRR